MTSMEASDAAVLLFKGATENDQKALVALQMNTLFSEKAILQVDILLYDSVLCLDLIRPFRSLQ